MSEKLADPLSNFGKEHSFCEENIREMLGLFRLRVHAAGQ